MHSKNSTLALTIQKSATRTRFLSRNYISAMPFETADLMPKWQLALRQEASIRGVVPVQLQYAAYCYSPAVNPFTIPISTRIPKNYSIPYFAGSQIDFVRACVVANSTSQLAKANASVDIETRLVKSLSISKRFIAMSSISLSLSSSPSSVSFLSKNQYTRQITFRHSSQVQLVN